VAVRKVLFVLGTLSDSDAEWLVGAGTRVELPAGAALIEQGRPVDGLYIVLEGRLRIAVERPSPRELARIGAGEIVGEMSFLDARPPSATVTTLEPSVVLSIPRADLARRLDEDAPFAARFYRALGVLLAHRLRDNLAYGAGGSLAEDEVWDDELDAATLDRVAGAGRRFEWMLRRLREPRR
jgi:bacteriocin-type transport-associated protein